MLCALTHLGQFEALDLVVAEEVVETESEAALEGCRRAHAGTEGHITGECGVEALDGYAESHHLTANAEDVASPSGLGALLVVTRSFKSME